MKANKPCIGIIHMGNIPEEISHFMAKQISVLFSLPSVMLHPLENPHDAFDPVREQYDAGIILKKLESMHFEKVNKVLCILTVDLFVPVFTHVFGEAREGGKVALASLYRLQDTSCDATAPSTPSLERTAKVGLHELCHLFNLHHCMSRDCLMHFSGVLKELDKTPLNFCEYCKEFLKTAISKESRK